MVRCVHTADTRKLWARQGWAWLGPVGRGMARLGAARRGMAWQGWVSPSAPNDGVVEKLDPAVQPLRSRRFRPPGPVSSLTNRRIL